MLVACMMIIMYTQRNDVKDKVKFLTYLLLIYISRRHQGPTVLSQISGGFLSSIMLKDRIVT
jgi:hypothetical protein